MAATLHKLSSPAGLSLEIPDSLSEAPELETGSVCLVAQADPWPYPGAFRPNLTVELDPLTPDRATVTQLSALTIAAQIALGTHVAACDLWPRADGTYDRRILSLYAALDTTVVQMQYVTIRGGRAITISVQHAADNHPHGSTIFEHALNSIECEFSDPLPPPDPATMPELDAFAGQRGLEIECLSGIRAAQPFRSEGPSLDDAALDALRRGKLRRGTDPTGLEAAGLVTHRGRMTEAGDAAHRALSSPAREVTIEVVSDGDPRVASLHVYQRRDFAAVVATPPPGSAGSGTTLDVISARTTPIALARWLGLAPAWTFALLEHDETTPGLDAAALDAAVLDARLTDPGAPVPEGANPALTRLWELPWQLVTLGAGASAGPPMTLIITTEAGSFRIQRDRPAGRASLTPVPSAQLLLALLQMSGFDVPAI